MPIGIHQRSFERYYSRPPKASFSPRLGVRNPHPKLQSLLSQERVKLYGFEYGRYIHRVHPNKSPLKILEKRERGRIQGPGRDCPNFLSTPIISGTGKDTNFKFCAHMHRIDRKKSLLKIFGKAAVGVLRNSGKFSGHPYFIGRIARSFLRQLSFPVHGLTL